MDKKIFEVSEINNYIKAVLDSSPVLDGVFIRGEVSNYKVYPSGHHYFTIKDAESSLRCVMFRQSAMRLRFRPESGMKVIAYGRISVFPRDGAYQLYVNELTPDGVGDLHVAFEQLKDKLFREGLFDSSHKKQLPKYPKKIAVITSSAGAAVRDVIRILNTRWPIAEVVNIPVRVQGEEAPGEICTAIAIANAYKIADVLIVGRGGGSIEDLWAFNDERVARAIYDSNIPVISAVGHEPDVTISDFVADVRASTPSNAAEIAVPDINEVLQSLDSISKVMTSSAQNTLDLCRKTVLQFAAKKVLQSPDYFIKERKAYLDTLLIRLSSAEKSTVNKNTTRFFSLASKLDALSPLKVLSRGYSIVKTEDGRIVKAKRDVSSGDKLEINLINEKINCTVD